MRRSLLNPARARVHGHLVAPVEHVVNACAEDGRAILSAASGTIKVEQRVLALEA